MSCRVSPGGKSPAVVTSGCRMICHQKNIAKLQITEVFQVLIIKCHHHHHHHLRHQNPHRSHHQQNYNEYHQHKKTTTMRNACIWIKYFDFHFFCCIMRYFDMGGLNCEIIRWCVWHIWFCQISKFRKCWVKMQAQLETPDTIKQRERHQWILFWWVWETPLGTLGHTQATELVLVMLYCVIDKLLC